MKRSLLLLVCMATVALVQAQKQKGTAYAITSVEKGASKWTEVRLVNVTTGEELKTIYQSAADAEVLNARTGKPIARKEGDARVIATDKPFATNSAACAYDKKNNRLYYTPMGIPQLRYIDLKAKTPKVFYFEEEAFGVVKGSGDVASQITRMVIAADGNGYALTNDGKHLLRFTTKKKPEITDLGALTDDLTNGRHSVHGFANYGGDMIADKKGNLYLITANNGVFVINVNSMMASYVGRIKGLPRGYSTNGAIAEGNSNVIVSSSRSTEGYYRFDLNTLKSEKISGAAAVFNASDLANGSFAFEQSDEEEKPKEALALAEPETPRKEVVTRNTISVYPNPVTTGFFKISFADQTPGRYNVQLVDAGGKVVSARNYNLVNKVQVEEFRLPQQLAAGNYLVRVVNEATKAPIVQQVVIQQ
ncbi:MAG: T9SS type A sorting domain-containing protein [Bacteroidota bacterium]|nr:T9SS type A sorting domain-containing protein [Bacteroidota bacterium]